MQQQALEIPVTPRYGFATFVTCSGNQSAFEFAQRVASPDELEKLLYLYGPPGSGKTHLLHAVGHALAKHSYRVISCLDLAGMKAEQITEHLASLPVLLLDDLDRLPDSPETRNPVWEAFNHHHLAGKPIAIAGRLHPKELANLDEHLTSRLLWGLVAAMDVSDDSSRMMLIAKLAKDRQILLPEEVAAWLLTVLPRDVGSLVEACDTLYRAALAQQRRISIKLARDLFRPADNIQ